MQRRIYGSGKCLRTTSHIYLWSSWIFESETQINRHRPFDRILWMCIYAKHSIGAAIQEAIDYEQFKNWIAVIDGLEAIYDNVDEWN